MAELVALLACVLLLAMLILWAVLEHMAAAEWTAIVEHHETMNALAPEQRAS